MVIKCIKNNIYDVEKSSTLFQYLKESVHLDDNELPLDIDKTYNVYGCMFKESHLWFYICEDDSFDDYPKAYAVPFFEIIDDSLSKYWVLGHSILKDSSKPEGYVYINITFREWAKDYFFYEKLVEGEKEEVSLFQKYKKLIDDEIGSVAMLTNKII